MKIVLFLLLLLQIAFGLKCLICTIAVNEIEGMLLENRTDTYIEKHLDQMCQKFPKYQTQCQEAMLFAMEYLPKLINRWNVSRVCTDLGMCKSVPAEPKDPQPVKTYRINLDEPPEIRWKQVCSDPEYRKPWLTFISELRELLGHVFDDIEMFGEKLFGLLPAEYRLEINGCSRAVFGNTTDLHGWLTILNLGYELTDGCTSIVAKNIDGTVMHGRNMDFWAGGPLTNTLKDVTFIADVYKNGTRQYVSTNFVGFMGVLSGQRPGGYSVTINTRYYPQGLKELFEEIYYALRDGYSPVSFVLRDVLTATAEYSEALKQLSYIPLIADVYYTIAGIDDGAVITRNRTAPDNVWSISDGGVGGWYVLQTNYDHWKPVPWFDNRRGPGMDAMNAIGTKMLLGGLLEVLSTKPVLNIQTTYTMLSAPKYEKYYTVTRYCEYPCVE
jgi:N-acylethanolamine-hydrolysing acid amidase